MMFRTLVFALVVGVAAAQFSPPEWPTEFPTEWPTEFPTQWPTEFPTEWPTEYPTQWPTEGPSEDPMPENYMGQLECGMPVSGTFEREDYHVYSFDVEPFAPGEDWGFVFGNTCGSNLDVTISVYDENQELFAGPFDGPTFYDYECECRMWNEDIVSGDMQAECLKPLLPVGTWFLVIEMAESPMKGTQNKDHMSYTFLPECPEDVTTRPEPTEEPSEDPVPDNYMGHLECNTPVMGVLGEGEEHIYSFDVEPIAPGENWGYVYGNTCDSPSDIALSVYDENNVLTIGPLNGPTFYDYECECRMWGDDIPNGNMNAECVKPPLNVGTWFLVISAAEMEAKNALGKSHETPYSFLPECPEDPTTTPRPTNSPEPTPIFSVEGTIGCGIVIQGTLDYGERHGYYFEIVEGEQPPVGATCGSMIDTVVGFVDADTYEYVAFYDDDKSDLCDADCGELNECVVIELPPGRYFAVVGGFGDSQSGDYVVGGYCEEPSMCVDHHEAVIGLSYELGLEAMTCHDVKDHCNHDNFGHYLRSTCGASCGGCDVWGMYCGHDDTFGLADFFGSLGIESRDDCAHLAACGYCAHEGWGSLMWHYCPCACKEFFEEMYDDGDNSSSSSHSYSDMESDSDMDSDSDSGMGWEDDMY